MKKLPRLLLPIALLASSICLAVPSGGCATTNPVVSKIEHGIDCLLPEIEAQVPSILSDVATALLSSDYPNKLKAIEDGVAPKLAKVAASDVVVCAVQASVAQAGARASTTSGAQPNAAAIQAHGNEYLQARGATFVGPPSSENQGDPMHYKDGREAKNGDKVMLIPSYGSPVVGILYDATAGNDFCNGRLALTSPSDPSPNLKECLHLEDALKAIAAAERKAPPESPPTT